MAYSNDISILESYINKIESLSLDVDFSSSWEGKAYSKQKELINSLNVELNNQISQLKDLIVVLENIDSYNDKKVEYNNYCNILDDIDSDNEKYNYYNNLKNTSYQSMINYKSIAESSLNSISSVYSSTINLISETNAEKTNVSTLPDTLFNTDSVDSSTAVVGDLVSDTPLVVSAVSYSSSSKRKSSGSNGGGSSSPSKPNNNYVVDKIDMSNVPDAPDDTICAANESLNVKSSSKGITSKFSKQTQEIITKHANDFNYANFKSIIGGDEDFNNYCKNVLGGVFAKWVGKNKKGEGKTASEFQEIAEYVFGLMVLYGFDYCNGNPGSYGKYGANNDNVASNSFYPSGVYNSPGKNDNTNGANIDAICAGTQKDGVNMTTNCNYGMDYLYKKAGIFGKDGAPNSSCNEESLLKYANENGGGITTRVDELQVGDIIQCYRGSVSEADAMSGDVDKWSKNGGWYHVCCVGEVEKNAAGETVAVVLYDAGHRFTNSGNFKYRIELDTSNTRNLGDYSDHWVGINLGTIVQDSFTSV